jgi:hypothetical protein
MISKSLFPVVVAIALGCNAPTSTPSGAFKTSADAKLQRDIVSNIMLFHGIRFPGCSDVKPTSAIVLDAKGTQGNSVVTEEWTVTGCGKAYIYKVKLVSSSSGGTNIGIEMSSNNPRIVPA